jgi:hypothetical protein
MLLRPLILAVVAAALAVPALAQSSMQSSASPAPGLTVTINPQNSSGQSGTATLADTSGGLQVKVTLTGEPSGASEPMHIHKGTCAKLDPVPYKALSNVVNGSSTTVVAGVTIADLQKGTYAINVHDEKNLAHYVACGDISSK